METKLGHGSLVMLLVLAPLWAGCGRAAGPGLSEPGAHLVGTPGESSSASIPAPGVGASAQRVSNRPPNPKGQVFIVEYHHIRSGKGDMFRTGEDFKKDLERLYKDGFRPCTISQYLDNKMDLPPGASPVVFTFDDANPSQFQILKDGSVDPNCAVGIWQAFAKLHPDFPLRATFYVLPAMWRQPKLVLKKVEMLHAMGSELGNHTMTHPILRKLTDDKVKQEFALASDRLAKYGESMPATLAFPFGVSPKNKSLVEGFEFKGKHYKMKGALLVGANPAPAPTDKKLNVYRIPRIIAYDGPLGIDDWLDKAEKGKIKLYVAK